jgi:HEPN domain-containing protein
MNKVVQEWIEKAEGDCFTVQRELRARKNANYDAACFHAQQSVEKHLKAVLQSANIRYPKTHDLNQLLRLCIPKHPLWIALDPELKSLSRYAVLFRYPGESATREDAAAASLIMKRVRTEVRKTLNLEIKGSG